MAESVSGKYGSVGSAGVNDGESVGGATVEEPAADSGPSGSGILLNDGSSFVLLNTEDFVLLNG